MDLQNRLALSVCSCAIVFDTFFSAKLEIFYLFLVIFGVGSLSVLRHLRLNFKVFCGNFLFVGLAAVSPTPRRRLAAVLQPSRRRLGANSPPPRSRLAPVSPPSRRCSRNLSCGRVLLETQKALLPFLFIAALFQLALGLAA